jgi:protein-tyrosine kinase
MALEKARARRAGQAEAAAPATEPPPAPARAPQPVPQSASQSAPQPAPRSAAPAAPVSVATPAPAPANKAGEARGTTGPRPASAEVMARWLALTEFEPKPSLMRRNHIIGYFSGREGGQEGGVIDMMRTRVLQEMKRNGWRRLAITSPNPGCGKTTTCLNLAFSLGRQGNQRTIVAELDMRRPGMAKMLGLRRSNSLSRVLEGKGDLAETLVRYGDNLAFGTNAGSARNPAELLQSTEITEALTRIEAEYDPTVILCDMPPMLMSDDMLAFAPNVDCVLLLAAAETTTMDDLDTCERELAAHTNVLGVVLNKCRYTDPSYGYGYY